MTYAEEISKVLQGMCLDNPAYYAKLDLDKLATHWTEFFTRAKLPPSKVYEVYVNAVLKKAESGSDYNILSVQDMLISWNALKESVSAIERTHIACNICNNDGTGLTTAFVPKLGKDSVIPCPNCFSKK